MRVGRGEVVGELRGLTAELARGSERAELLWNGGSMARVSLPAFGVERRRCSGARKRGMSERARGMGRWGFCGAPARERSERRALQRARHRGGEVAAARAVLAAWRRERAPARGKEGGGKLRRDAWKLPGRRWPGLALHGGRAALTGGAVKQSKQAGRRKGKTGCFAISKNSRGPNVKQQ